MPLRVSLLTSLFALFLLSCKVVQDNKSPVAKTIPVNSPHTSIPFYPLNDETDLDLLIKEIGNARIVLLGESTHGTAEFYRWRKLISKKLIEEKGFDAIAVEGDWTDLYRAQEFISGPRKDSLAAVEVLKQYDRWPSSMWSNTEVASLITWLNNHNQAKERKIGFYGLDIYSFWEWASNGNNLPSSLKAVAQQFSDSFSIYDNDALKYSRAVKNSDSNHQFSTRKISEQIQKVTGSEIAFEEKMFQLQQQGLLALAGEKYFRTMVTDKVGSWNTRDFYMAETVKRLLAFYGKNSRLIVWLHNGHAGNAHYSQMREGGYTSVGQILDREFGSEQVFKVGFGTNTGFVLAGYHWYAPVQELSVPPARTDSWEAMLHSAGATNKIVLSKDIVDQKELNRWVAFRSIGASYSNMMYGRAIVPRRFDAFIYIDSTSALRPLH